LTYNGRKEGVRLAEIVSELEKEKKEKEKRFEEIPRKVPETTQSKEKT